MAHPVDITDLLRRWGEGEAGAFDQLFPLMYDRMRQLAHQRRLRLAWPGARRH